MTRPTWDSLEGRRQRTAARRDDTDPAADQERADLSELAAVCRDVLGTERGKRLLALLRRRTKDRVLGPGVSESALWFIEGQRQLVDQLERATAAGLQVEPERLRDELTKG